MKDIYLDTDKGEHLSYERLSSGRSWGIVVTDATGGHALFLSRRAGKVSGGIPYPTMA